MRYVLPKELKSANDVYFVLRAIMKEHIANGAKWYKPCHYGEYGRYATISMRIEDSQGAWPAINYEHMLKTFGSGKTRRSVWILSDPLEP
jgi:hypothetical protein